MVVLGGGPAGLEGAWVAARRGFRVILFEKAPQLGGQLLLAAGTPRKEKIQWLLDSLCFRCRQAGVELRTGCAPTLKELGRLSPYAILDATGGVPGIPGRDPGGPGESAGLARRRRSSPAPWTSGRRAWWWWARG